MAVALAAAELHHDLAQGTVGHAVLAYLITFFAVWWAWVNFTWFASAYDTDDVLYRLLTCRWVAFWCWPQASQRRSNASTSRPC